MDPVLKRIAVGALIAGAIVGGYQVLKRTPTQEESRLETIRESYLSWKKKKEPELTPEQSAFMTELDREDLREKILETKYPGIVATIIDNEVGEYTATKWTGKVTGKKVGLGQYTPEEAVELELCDEERKCQKWDHRKDPQYAILAIERDFLQQRKELKENCHWTKRMRRKDLDLAAIVAIEAGEKTVCEAIRSTGKWKPTWQDIRPNITHGSLIDWYEANPRTRVLEIRKYGDKAERNMRAYQRQL